MAFESDALRLFGLDLASLPRLWRKGWEEALEWPALRWFSPREPVRVLLPDGQETVRMGASARSAAAGAWPRGVAVVLPESAVLVRELLLPPLPHRELCEAIALEVAALSPFPNDEVAWGWRAQPAGERLRVRLALAARAHVAAHLDSQGERLSGIQPEVWADADCPVVLAGYAEGARAARLRAERRRILALTACAGLLVLALAATPVLQARQRLADAQAQLARVEAETAELLAARNALARSNQRARAVRAHLAERPDVLGLVETLSDALPDDAYLTRLEVDGRTVRLTGRAGNASQLMDMLGARREQFREVRTPSPISRAAGADKENFSIELTLAGKEEP